MLTRALVPVLGACAAIGTTAGAAHAAYPTNSFSVSYGQTYTKGSVTWYNRSLNVSGSDKAQPGECRSTQAFSYAGDGTLLDSSSGDDGWVCVAPGGSATSNGYSFTISANVPGGASYVVVELLGSSYSAPYEQYLTQTTVYHP